MTRDAIVDEVRAFRDEIAKEFNYDIGAIFAALRKMEATGPGTMCRLRQGIRWRTLTNPCCSKTAQSCRPEKIFSLPNSHLKPGHEYLAVHAALDLRSVGRFEEQLQGFDQVHACFIDRGALAGNVHFRAQGYIAVALPFDDRRQLPGLHGEEAYHATAPATTFPSSIHLVAPTVPFASHGRRRRVSWLRLLALIETESVAQESLKAMHLPSDIPESHLARPPRPPPGDTGGGDDWLN